MSNYNKYADAVNESMKVGRANYIVAVEEVKKAREKRDRVRESGASATEILKAESNYITAEENKKITRQGWLIDLNNTIKENRAEFLEELAKNSALKPGEVDTNAVTLINSGALTLKDLSVFADKYQEENNVTMLRLLKKYANDNYKNVGDEQRGELQKILLNLETDADRKTREFDTICNTARIYSGQNHAERDNTSEYITDISAHWFDAELQNLVKCF